MSETEQPVEQRAAELLVAYKRAEENLRESLLAIDGFILVASQTLIEENTLTPEEIERKSNQINEKFKEMAETIGGICQILVKTADTRNMLVQQQNTEASKTLYRKAVIEPAERMYTYLDTKKEIYQLSGLVSSPLAGPVHDSAKTLYEHILELEGLLEEMAPQPEDVFVDDEE